jgi:plasmid stabilization system protein ParE
MARLVFSALADADTAEIYTRLAANGGRKAAQRYDAAFERLYERLSEFPESGALRKTLGEHIRIGVISPFLVIYRHVLGEERLTVLRVLHGRRRVSGRLLARRN